MSTLKAAFELAKGIGPAFASVDRPSPADEEVAKVESIFLRAALNLAVKTLVRIDKGGEERPNRKELRNIIAHLQRITN